jgi:gamma-glutamylcysteine synthetase
VNEFETKLIDALNRIADSLRALQSSNAANQSREALMQRFSQRHKEMGARIRPVTKADAMKHLGISDERTLASHCETLGLNPDKLTVGSLDKISTSIKEARSRPNAARLAKNNSRKRKL